VPVFAFASEGPLVAARKAVGESFSLEMTGGVRSAFPGDVAGGIVAPALVAVI